MKINTACELGVALIEKAVLSNGNHEQRPTDLAEPCEVCIMELRCQVGMLCEWEGWTEEWSDLPAGDSGVIGRFLQVINDRFRLEERQQLKQFVLRDLTDKGPEVEQRRMFRVADWAVRTIAPIRYEALGMPEKAQMFRAFDPIVDKASAQKATYAAATYAAYAAATYAAYADYADAAATYAAAYVAATYAATYAAARKTIFDEVLSIINELIEMGNEVTA